MKIESQDMASRWPPCPMRPGVFFLASQQKGGILTGLFFKKRPG
jgi:hypothetical protein